MTDDVERVKTAILKFFEAKGWDKQGDKIWHEPGDIKVVGVDVSDLARAAITAMQGWSKIESAPKKDVKFLIYGAGKIMIVDGYILHTARWGAPEHLSLAWATHWQPLPTPPESENG